MFVVNIVALVIVIIGAINTGLVGFFEYDAIRTLLMADPVWTRVVFAVIGLAGLWSLTFLGRCHELCCCKKRDHHKK